MTEERKHETHEQPLFVFMVEAAFKRLFQMEELFIPLYMKPISEGSIKDCTRHREGRRQGGGGE